MNAGADIDIRPLSEAEVEPVGAVLGLARLYQCDGSYLVAWIDGEPAGHAYLTLTFPPELQDVEVRARFRRRGIASALVAAAQQAARAAGAGQLTVTVSQHNPAAQALYARLGFSDTGQPARRVAGTIQIRTGPLEVDDLLLTWAKLLDD